MPSIPLTNKIHTVTSGVETINKGSAQANAGREAYTIQDLAETIGSGVSSIVAGDGIEVSSPAGDVTVSAKIAGTSGRIPLYDDTDSIVESLLSQADISGEEILFCGGGATPLVVSILKESTLRVESQLTAPSSAVTAGTAGDTVTYFNEADPTDAANGLYVCTKTGVGGSAQWGKAQLTQVV